MTTKLTTLEELGDEMRAGFREMDTHFKSIGEHFVKVESRLEEIPTRGELGELITKVFDYSTLKVEHERMKQIMHEKWGVMI